MKKYVLTSPAVSSRLDFESDLNPQQLAVVSAPAAANLVIAGAGTGKTRTLTYRVAYLIDQGLPPSALMLCTFTNKAAREMLSRVDHLTAGQARNVWGGTFHHLANRLLREFAPLLGYTAGFSILDQEDNRELMSACIAEAEKTTQGKMLPRAGVLCDLLSFACNTLTPLDQVIVQRAPTLMRHQDKILTIARAFRARKLAINAMNFDDLLTNHLRLLCEFPEAAASITERFLHVLVDEYQDTNALQCELVDRMAAVHGALTVVGDDAQSIYAFRGADPKNMTKFHERWPEACLFKLETNYRSTPEVLSLANQSIQNNRQQIPKELSAVRPGGTLPAQVTVRDVNMQASFVAQRVTELAADDVSLRDMAVLYRAHNHSLELQVELTRREIPYVVRSGVRFFEQAHIKDVLSYLRILENPRDELSWIRLLKMQPGIGRSGAASLFRKLQHNADPLDYALGLEPQEIPARARKGWQQLCVQLQPMTDPVIRQDAAALIESLMAGGYRALLPELYPNAQSRAEDIEQLALYAVHFESPSAFLSELNLLSEFGAETTADKSRPEDHLTLSTIHQAKGLEWKTVFVIGLNEGLFPHPRSLHEEGGEEEERRLFYVSVTRCKDELYLLAPLVVDRRGQSRSVIKASRFVKEVDSPNLLERWSVADSPGL